MVNFLYLSFFFPPLAGPEPRHNLSRVRCLYKKDFIPTIITVSSDFDYPKDDFLVHLIPKDIEIKRFKWPHSSNKFFKKFRSIIKLPENPLIFRGWKSIYDKAKKEIFNKNFQFIYSVHGIGAVHLAALKLKKETGLPWVAEFRDPWIHNVIIWKYMKDRSLKYWYLYQLIRTKRFLKKILEYADLVVVESPIHGNFLVRDFDTPKGKIVSYGMGYDESYFPRDEDCLINFTKKPVIGFVGSDYYGYDEAINNFVWALKELERDGYEFTLISVGSASLLFSQYAREIGLKNFVPIDRVSLSFALSIMKRMDFGVVCTFKKHKSHINSKIWEYLRANLSILAIVPKDGAMAQIINEGKCGYIFPYNAKEMVPVLKNILSNYRNGKVLRAEPKFIVQFSAEYMVDKLVKKIKKIL